MTKEQKNMVLAAIDAAEEYKSVTGKKIMSLSVSSEFFEALKELVFEKIDEQEPCEDCVSRDAVHDMLENLPVTVEDKWFNWLQKASLRLAELPPVTPKQRWIPLTWDEIKCESSFPDDMDG